MIPRPPRSTLFPTRRSSDLTRRPGRMSFWWRRMATTSEAVAPPRSRARARADQIIGTLGRVRELGLIFALLVRSEEHTSELQSRLHLVCRLLLEKKNSKMRD